MPTRQLLTDFDTNGDGPSRNWFGGRAVVSAWGTWGGATAKLRWSPDEGVTWMDADKSGDTYVTFTDNGSGEVVLPPCKIRFTVSGGTGASISAKIWTV